MAATTDPNTVMEPTRATGMLTIMAATAIMTTGIRDLFPLPATLTALTAMADTITPREPAVASSVLPSH
jgi:hypothetical protein